MSWLAQALHEKNSGADSRCVDPSLRGALMSRLLQVRTLILTLLIITGIAAACAPEAWAQRGRTYSEPEVDVSIPVGVPNPPFLGEVPEQPLQTQRTGTYGGTLVYSILGEVETFNPVEPKGATSQELRSLVFSGLLSYNNGGWKTAPLLATHWEVSEDKKSWTFFLRRGVRFSDGKPLTIDDVEFSFQAIFHPEIPSSIRDGFQDEQGRFPTFKVDREKQSITFTTHDVDSQFLTHIGNVSIIPKHVWKDHLQETNPTLGQQMLSASDPATIIGSGPFVLKKYVPAEKVEYERNPYYWEVDARNQRLPYFDRVVIALVKDQNLQVQKFLAGEHHVLDTLPPDRFKEVEVASKKAGAGFDLLRLGVSLNTNWISFNLHPGKNLETGVPFVAEEKQYWFNNFDFRRAINHALDRRGMVKSALDGRGRPIWASITPGNKNFYCKDVVRYPHDVELSNSLLDGLGWKDTDGDGIREDDKGRKISFGLNTNVENNTRLQMCNLIKDDLAKIGVEVVFKALDFNGLVTRLRDSHEWDMILLGWGSGVPADPSNSKNINRSSGRLHVWYPQQPQPSPIEWEREVDRYVGLLDRELDESKRKEYSDRIQIAISEQIPILYLVAANQYSLARSEIGNVWPSLLRPQVTWNIQELYLKNASAGAQ